MTWNEFQGHMADLRNRGGESANLDDIADLMELIGGHLFPPEKMISASSLMRARAFVDHPGGTRDEMIERLARMLDEAQGIVLPGWTCPSCKGFNGEAKERLEKCRGCEAARP